MLFNRIRIGKLRGSKKRNWLSPPGQSPRRLFEINVSKEGDNSNCVFHYCDYVLYFVCDKDVILPNKVIRKRKI